MVCKRCDDVRWVCERHTDRPWAGMTGGEECCGGAGMPCPICNPSDYDNPPVDPPGWTTLCEAE